MLMEMLSGKLHRATVTDADLNYIGSITIDKKLLKASKIRIGQKVDIVNINNGERFSTYAIEGKENSGIICLNGAAARKVSVNDKVIIIAYAMYNEKELENYKPAVVLLDDKNNILSKEEKLIGGIFK